MNYLSRFRKGYKTKKDSFTFINPFPAFQNWFNHAKLMEKEMDPLAMSLSTINRYF